MTNEEREIQRKLRVLQHAEKIGNARKACRYFGVGRSSFYRWRNAYKKFGEAGLKNAKSIPKNPANQTPPEIVEKVLYLRRKYHLGPIRIVWYLARYHGIKISDAGVYRILRRNGLNRLPRGTRMRKLHTKRYQKQVPGHHIQVDVKFLTFKRKHGEKVRRFQYTAIDDATRVRALKIYEKHTQANAIDFIDHIIEKFPFRIREVRPPLSLIAPQSTAGQWITAMNSKPSSIGMSKISAFDTRTSSVVHRSSMARSSGHTDLTSKNSISY